MKHCIIYKNGKFKLQNYHVLFASDDIYEVCNFAIRKGKIRLTSIPKVKGSIFIFTTGKEIKGMPGDFYLLSNFPDEQSALNFLKPAKKFNRVQCIQDGMIFDSMIEACIHYGIRADMLSRHINASSVYKSIKGLTFIRL